MTEDRSETLRQLKKQRGHIRSTITSTARAIQVLDVRHSGPAARTLAEELRKKVELWRLWEETFTRDIESVERAEPCDETAHLRSLAKRMDELSPVNREVVDVILRENGWDGEDDAAS